ncbi:MAG: SIS domain-containing protein [Anaerolineae bacterium]|nr:SIS domain-containing protein [Anaerolineae bacterium]
MPLVNFSNIRTYPLAQRRNLVHLTDLLSPGVSPPAFVSAELDELAARVIAARQAGRPVIWMMGAHVIKSGLSRLLVNLLKRGIITHIAGNGAVSIHDFELALIGETSEDVATSLEDGTFGMADETGRFMHRAIQEGVRDGLGYGAAIGRFIAEHPELFPHRDINVLYTAYTLGIPATIHITLGADIIHQHPDVDFAALGAASGADFRRFVTSVSDLEGGVFLNFGSAVTGPEVFLKALTIARNLGHTVAHITTANFDLLPLGDYHRPVGYDDPHYYYRPRKNIVLRPVSLGGHGYHITGDHRVTIPNLYHKVMPALGEPRQDFSPAVDVSDEMPPALQALIARQPALQKVSTDLLRTFRLLLHCFASGGTLFLCGNGGSMADALHISGELLKSYTRRRALPERLRARLSTQADGDMLIRNLEPGLHAVVLGINPSLSSAVANDMPDRDIGFAQELLALARPGDVLLSISTSGNARNVIYAAQTARALGLTVVGMTGEGGGRLVEVADITIRVPAARTDRAQELHLLCYHALCEMLEEAIF